MLEVVRGCGHQMDIQCQITDINYTAKFCILWTHSVEQSALPDYRPSLSLNRFERQLKTYHFESKPNDRHSWRFCDL